MKNSNRIAAGRYISRGLLATLLMVSPSWMAASALAATQPNVLILYADDLGWGELGCQGNPEIPTPNIDSIAKSGVRFTQGYVAATYCSPSRAGLMTGRYPTRFGHENNAVPRNHGLPLTETTLADRLKKLGYSTICIGKWHLGQNPEYRPTNRGFDQFYGTLANTPFYHPTQFVDSRESNEVKKIDDANFYTTDAYADRAVAWIDEHKQGPWFVYLPFNAQHAPLQAPQKYLDRFPNISDSKRKTFAAMLSGMDDAVGRVLAKVRELGQEENTIVFFVADNGGPTNGTTSQNGPLRGYKTQTYEGGPRVPFLAQWKGKMPAGKVFEHPVLNLDIMPTVVTAAGGKVEADWKLDGVDLLPYVTGANSARPHDTLYWKYGKQWAVRQGDYKLVLAAGNTTGIPELYNLAADIGESNNLASAEPEKASQLQALWNAWNAEQAEPIAVENNAGKKNKKANSKPAARKAARAAQKSN